MLGEIFFNKASHIHEEEFTNIFYLGYDSSKLDDVLQDISNLPKPYHLCVSGGVDSQAMAFWFQKYFPIKDIVINHLHTGYNVEDSQSLVRFLGDFPFHNIIQLDLNSFFQTDMHMRYAHEYQCISPQLASHLFLMDNIPPDDGTIFLPGTPVMYVLDDAGHPCNNLPDYNQCVYYRYARQASRHVVPFLWQYASCIVQRFGSAKPIEYEQSYKHKCFIYEQGGLNVVPQVAKFNGFERYKAYLKNEHRISFDAAYRLPMQQAVRSKKSFGAIGAFLAGSLRR